MRRHSRTQTVGIFIPLVAICRPARFSLSKQQANAHEPNPHLLQFMPKARRGFILSAKRDSR